MAAPFAIAILAGGAATRLQGRDKGLEPLLGRPLVAWIVEAAAAMTAAPALIVANRHLDDYAKYAPTIADVAGGYRGPLAGIAAALAACESPWLMTLPVDCPQPPHDLAARLLASAQAASVRAIVAHDGARRQPLFAIYRRELAASAAAAVALGQGVWQWQNAVGAIELDFSDRRAQFQNLNTPEDFVAYVAEQSP